MAVQGRNPYIISHFSPSDGSRRTIVPLPVRMHESGGEEDEEDQEPRRHGHRERSRRRVELE
jgi:hypothetical protein